MNRTKLLNTGIMRILSLFAAIFLFLSFTVKGQIQDMADFSLSEGSLPAHPRLLFPKGEAERLKKQFEKDPLWQDLMALLKIEADSIVITAPVVSQQSVRGNLLKVARLSVYRLVTLGTAYRFYKDPVYADRAEKELLQICDFKTWDPKHYLDVAEFSTAVAIGYDWFYDQLQPSTRKKIEKALYEKAFQHALAAYANPKGPGAHWATSVNNWNVVCNTGMTLAALAVGDRYPEEASEIIKGALPKMPAVICDFAPEGVWYEGPAYWGYTNMFLSLLFKGLEPSLNTTFGLDQYAGLEQTADFYTWTVGPSGLSFNFADAQQSECIANPIYFALGGKYGNSRAIAFYRDYLQNILQTGEIPRKHFINRFFFLALPWFQGEPKDGKTALQSSKAFQSVNPLFCIRKGTEKDSYWFSIKGGKTQLPHQQMDVGTFVVENQGVRWAVDLGGDNYSIPGFWVRDKEESPRWKVFRNQSVSHNVVVFNEQTQCYDGIGTLESADDKASQPYARFDLTGAYKTWIDGFSREVRLLGNETIEMRDAWKEGASIKSVRWNWLTDVDVKVGKNRITLTKDGKRFYIHILSPKPMEVRVVKPIAYPEEAWPVGQGIKQIQVFFEPSITKEIKVQFGPNKKVLNEGK